MLERLLFFTLCTYAASFSALNCASPAEAHKLEALEDRGRQPRSKLDARLRNDAGMTDGSARKPAFIAAAFVSVLLKSPRSGLSVGAGRR